MKLEQKKLFNPEADQSNRLLVGGDSTNMMVLSDSKYDWSGKIYRHMMGNFWIPEEISLNDDSLQYNTLPKEEREAFDKIISFLVFLDSLQTVNLPNINDYVTLPEVNLLVTIQGYQEALHSQSYGYILESVVSAKRRREIYDIAITDKYLLQRNKYIADIYQEFIDDQTDIGFVKVMMANYILEGIYFYSGFSFFYNLARFGKMTGVATEIKYINRDELSHLALFQGMFRELRKERPDLFTDDMEAGLEWMMEEAVDHEISWAKYVIGDKIQGLSSDLLSQYIKYLSNHRMKAIGLKPRYPEYDTNPLPFIERFTNFNQTKTDFFEEKVINYAKGTMNLDELDNIDL